MRLPSESSSSWTHLGFAAFTRASLKAWSEFPILAVEDRSFLAVEEGSLKRFMDALLKEARETENVLYFGRPEAMARQNAWLVLIRRVLNEVLLLVVLRVGNGSKDHPKVREFLPKLLATVTRLELAFRPKATGAAADRLDALDATFEEKAQLVAKLRDAATGAQTALDAAAEAWSAWEKERSEEVVAKGRLRLELERIYHSLGSRFPGQRDFVESFFLRGSKPSESDPEETTEPEEATEPEETTEPTTPT